MTCGWTGVCHSVFRKLPSCNYRPAIIPTFMVTCGGKLPIFLTIFCQFWKTHPYFRKTAEKSCSESFGPKNPLILVAHTHTLNMLLPPPPWELNKSVMPAYISAMEGNRSDHMETIRAPSLLTSFVSPENVGM